MFDINDLFFVSGDIDDEAQAKIDVVNDFTETWLLGITPTDTYLDFIQEKLCNVEDHVKAYKRVFLELGIY